MGIIRLLSKLTGVEKKVKWSQCKRIKVDGPDFWGRYEVFVDSALDVAFFLPKSDFSVHILAGNVIEASRWLKYEPSGKLLNDESIPKGNIEWKINPTRVLLRGRGLPPDKSIYKGKVISNNLFYEKITNGWMVSHVHKLQAQMKQH